MADETPQQPSMSSNMVKMTVAMFEYEKLIVVGLLSALMMILLLSFYALQQGASTTETLSFVLAFYKDLGLIIAGAIAGALTRKGS